MSKTIKELAEELGVSKTAIRKHMSEDFRLRYTKTTGNGVITIDSAGCRLIAVIMGKILVSDVSDEPETTETIENSENMTIPRSVWVFMEDRIKHLEAELTEERKHSRSLADELAKLADKAGKLADQAQQLHAGEMQQQRLEAGVPQAEAAIDVQQAEPEQQAAPRRKWWPFW